VGVGLDLDGLVAAGGADKLPDRPPSPVFEPSADVQDSEGAERRVTAIIVNERFGF